MYNYTQHYIEMALECCHIRQESLSQTNSVRFTLLSAKKQKTLLRKATMGSISMIILYSGFLFITVFVILNEGIKRL